MSNYGAPGSFQDDIELERQLQEEYRRRQALQQGAMQQQLLARGGGGVGRDAYSGFGGSATAYGGYAGLGQGQQQQATSAYHHPSAYTQVTNPYSGLAEARAAYARGNLAAGGTGAGSDAPSSQTLYAQQQQQQQRRAYQAQAQQPQPQPQQLFSYCAPAGGGVDPYGYGSASGGMPYRDYAPTQASQLLAQAIKHESDPYAALRSKPKPKLPMDQLDESLDDDSGMPRKQMLQKVTSTINKSKSTARIVIKDGTTVIEDGTNQWFTGCVPLGLEDDKYWLSELQVYLRANFAEAFGATEEDIAAPMHGRNKPIALGQVGIRCMHCKHDNPAERGQQATSYPSLISGIYNSVQQMLRLHLDCCLSMPDHVRSKIDQLKLSCSSRGGRKQYWIDSAKRLGLVDTPHGIHFGRDPMGPLPPLAGPSVNSKEGRQKKKGPPKSHAALVMSHALQSPEPSTMAMAPPSPAVEMEPFIEHEEPLPSPIPVDTRPLVFPEDQDLISDYLYLTLEQMAPCVLMEADRVGCYKTRQVGFPGLACRHCVGQAGCGRYFPASEASLSQTTTSQTIMNHVRNCRRCPIEIRENLDIMKRAKVGPDGKRADKPKHGGRKVFFHRLWCRIQSLPIDESMQVEAKPRRPRKSRSPRKNKAYDSDAESEAEDSASENEEEEDLKPKSRKKKSSGKQEKSDMWYHGCVRLTKTDDTHWLSEMECFARSELVEVFTLSGDEIHDYAGRKEPAEGQVGIRCTFCKSLDYSERPASCVALPDTLLAIHTKVTDMIRLHFPNCPSLPDDARATFKSYKGFDAKVANDDSQQYWVDAARDIGLMNIPPDVNAPGAWGITFRRDPLEPSPADELDLEPSTGASLGKGKNMLVYEDDRGACTDHVMLLLRQVRPCRFQKSDMRAGSISRGRERSIGFPGLCCKHCVGRNSLGRYFPISPKNLTDSTVNSIQTHVASCSYCPEPIKASLAYLSHRSILQKTELSGSWKKVFFQKVWDRLHVNSGWTSVDDVPQHSDASGSGEDDHDEEEDDDEEQEEEEQDDEEEEQDDDEGSDSESEDGEKSGPNQMNALIKAAALWLTNQDAASTDGKKGRRGKKPSAGGDGDDDIPSGKKRRTRR